MFGDLFAPSLGLLFIMENKKINFIVGFKIKEKRKIAGMSDRQLRGLAGWWIVTPYGATIFFLASLRGFRLRLPCPPGIKKAAYAPPVTHFGLLKTFCKRLFCVPRLTQ